MLLWAEFRSLHDFFPFAIATHLVSPFSVPSALVNVKFACSVFLQ